MKRLKTGFLSLGTVDILDPMILRGAGPSCAAQGVYLPTRRRQHPRSCDKLTLDE